MKTVFLFLILIPWFSVSQLPNIEYSRTKKVSDKWQEFSRLDNYFRKFNLKRDSSKYILTLVDIRVNSRDLDTIVLSKSEYVGRLVYENIIVFETTCEKVMIMTCKIKKKKAKLKLIYWGKYDLIRKRYKLKPIPAE